MATIYHNPRCSKSRQTLELIKNQGTEPEVVLYLESTLNAPAITELLSKLGIVRDSYCARANRHTKSKILPMPA